MFCDLKENSVVFCNPIIQWVLMYAWLIVPWFVCPMSSQGPETHDQPATTIHTLLTMLIVDVDLDQETTSLTFPKSIQINTLSFTSSN